MPLLNAVSHPRSLPARAGIGLRAAHYDEFLATRPPVGWVEVISENLHAEGGRQPAVLEAVRRDYPLSLHGVGLSLGSADPLDRGHLARLARLVARFEPALVSEHASWSSVDGVFANDLLPLPLDEESLAHLVSRVGQVQDALGRELLVENVSTYLRPGRCTMSEWEFHVELARRAGCRLLLDVNNVYVNAVNHGFDAGRWIDAVPADLVGEIHLAGHHGTAGDDLLIDTHDRPVPEPVWALYRRAVARLGHVPALIEWDARLPALEVLLAEARRADERVADCARVA